MAVDDLIIQFGDLEADESWPSFDEIRRSGSRVFVDEARVSFAKSRLLEDGKCLIRGPEGRGKTVLARNVCGQYLGGRQEVWIVDFALTQVTANLLKKVSIVCSARTTKLILFENVHLADADLVEDLLGLKWDPQIKAPFLFTQRRINGARDGTQTDPLQPLVEAGLTIDLDTDIEIAEQIILLRTGGSYALDPSDREWLNYEIGTPPNLRRLKWYLDAWQHAPKPRRLAEVLRQEVYANVHMEIIQKIPNKFREALILVAAILQFDISFDPLVLRIEERDALERENLISIRGGAYRVAHASDAALIVEAYASKYGASAEEQTSRLVTEYVHRGPRNYVQLFRSLMQPRNKKFVKPLDNQEFSALLASSLQEPISSTTTLLNYLSAAYNTGAAQGIWRLFEAKLAEHGESVQSTLGEKMAGATLEQLLLLARMPAKVAPSLRVELEKACTEDALFARAKTDLPKIGTLLREEFLSPVLTPSESAAKRLAKRVGGLPLSSILRFLHNLKPAVSDSFLGEFSLALSVEPAFVESLAKSSFRNLTWCRDLISKIDPEVASYFKKVISEDLQIRSLSRSSLKRIANQLVRLIGAGHLNDTVAPKTMADRMGRAVFEALSHGDLQVKASKSQHPFRLVCRFSSFLVQVRIEPTVMNGLLAQMLGLIESLEFNCTAKELMWLLINLRELDEGLWRVTACKAASEFNLSNVARGLDPAGAQLIWHILQVDAGRARSMADIYFAFDPSLVFDHWKTEDLDRHFAFLLGNLAQVDLDATQSWVRRRSGDLWFETFRNDLPSRSFACLFKMHFIDARLGTEILNKLISSRYSSRTAVKPEELSLVGLGYYLVNGMAVDVVFPTAHEIGHWLAEKRSLADWAFALYAARRNDTRLAFESLAAAVANMRKKGTHFSIADGLNAVVNPELRSVLSEVLR